MGDVFQLRFNKKHCWSECYVRILQ